VKLTEAKEKNINAPFSGALRNRIFLLLLLNSVYLTIFIRYFPNKLGGLGHDYAYWFPRMIAGTYWYMQNGVLSVPWFTPALNGGNLLYADPESIYFSVPQFLSFFVDPLTSITITFILFSFIGTWGFYWFLRKIFHCGFWSSLLGAALFLFNGFFTYRMIVGHLPYHAYMLVPWILICIFWEKDRFAFYRETAWSAAAALLLSYCFYAGAIHFLIPLALSVFAIGLVYSHVFGHRESKYIWWRVGMSFAVTSMLCGSKLVAAWNVIKNLPREAYALPGMPNLVDVFLVPFRSLFVSSITRQEANHLFENLQWALARHEFEYGITFVPLLFLAVEIGRRLIQFHTKKNLAAWGKMQWFYFGGIILLLLLPIFVNYYTPRWNSFLKTLPVIKNSSTLVRWYAMYIPIGILLSVLGFEKIKIKPGLKSLLAIVSILVVIGVNLIHDKSFCFVNHYDYRPLSQGFLAVKNQGQIPKIEYVGSSAAINNASQKIAYTKDAVINIGMSYLLSRFSLFGYQFEYFPQKDKLKVGRVDRISEGYFNLKNPSCYLYPVENDCDPGDHFRADQIEGLDNFVNYRSFPFKTPLTQRIANWMSLLTFLGCLTLLGIDQIFRYAHPFCKINCRYNCRNLNRKNELTNV
jgi:hypothetical protein